MDRHQQLAQFGEMLQDLMQELDVEMIAEVVAQTAHASADAITDNPRRRAELLWYARQFRKLAEGPPDERLPAPRATGKEALTLAFQRLVLRANRLASATTLPADDLAWIDQLSRKLGMVATEMGL
jgi:hypothetical protein